METTQPNPIYRSFVETFISEFSGIPGIEMKIVSPTCFRLFDITSVVKNADGSFKEGRCGCSVITVSRRTEFSGKRKWIFEYHSRANEIFYTVDELTHNSIVEYQENSILIGMLNNYFDLSVGLSGDPKCNSSLEYFAPTLPYINLAVILGVLLCGERRLITDCHYHGGKKLVIFPNTLVANDIIKDFEKLKTENSDLLEELQTTKRLIAEHLEYKSDTKTYIPKTSLSPNIDKLRAGPGIDLIERMSSIADSNPNKAPLSSANPFIPERTEGQEKLTTFAKIANFDPQSEEI
jgi:hypothetical protein